MSDDSEFQPVGIDPAKLRDVCNLVIDNRDFEDADYISTLIVAFGVDIYDAPEPDYRILAAGRVPFARVHISRLMPEFGKAGQTSGWAHPEHWQDN